MNEFVQIAAPVMAIVSFVLVTVGFFPSLGKSKAFQFLCGESSFVTVGLYAALVVVGTSWFAPFGVALWFVTGSVKFAHAAWLAE